MQPIGIKMATIVIEKEGIRRLEPSKQQISIKLIIPSTPPDRKHLLKVIIKAFQTIKYQVSPKFRLINNQEHIKTLFLTYVSSIAQNGVIILT